jgi:hypothetical protein
MISVDVEEAHESTFTSVRRGAGQAPGERMDAARSRATSAVMAAMFARHIGQADEGCDFDFLETAFGKPVAEPSIY